MVISILVAILILLVVGVFVKMILYPTPVVVVESFVDDDDEDEVIVTTTTTTTTVVTEPEPVPEPEAPKYEIVGELKVKLFGRNKQECVTDPVDKDRVFVNTNDDLYEDGAGKIWKLVRTTK